MANIREILSKVDSIKNTQKITGAMELVAASKMKEAIIKMNNIRSYINNIDIIIKNIMSASINYPNPYLYKRKKVTTIGYIIISTDRGLCGGLNINLFKYILKNIKNNIEDNIKINLCTIGLKAKYFFSKLKNINIISETNFNNQENKNNFEKVKNAIKIIQNKFIKHEIDKLYISNNKFISTIKQKPILKVLLPIQDIFLEEEKKIKKEKIFKGNWDYIYERDIDEVLNNLCHRYIEAKIRGAILENAACEQAARMLTMKNATDNSNNIINKLKLDYNKERQNIITQELIEICLGASAV